MHDLLAKIQDKSARVAVVGQGYVGLPLAVEFASAGLRTIGIDLSTEKVAAINGGRSYIPDVPTARVARLVSSGYLSATTDFDVLNDCDCVSVAVPTPLSKTKDPDLSFILSAADAIAKRMHPGMLIVLESTTYPGTTEDVFLPRIRTNGYQVGSDVFLAFSPERVDPGNPKFHTRNTPKVIGGVTPACTQVASALYHHAVDCVVPVSSTIVAEMVKLLENTFRMINIGMVNELALICNRLGVDVWEVIEAAATKPFGFMKFTPGPGLGGHCIPIDPLYLSWKMKSLNYSARFIELASEINTNMPRFVVGKVQDALNEREKPLKGSAVLVLGAAYKPDIDDLRESPALDVIHLLQQKGAKVSYHDPFIPHLDHDGWQLDCVPDLMGAVAEADCVVIITNHSSYDYPALLEHACLIVDTRNALGKLGWQNPKVVRL
ncbi:MAG: nucleotide sugar dehydrogenase [Anaerolineaceae bacterium]|nr:nucleotide sugar dehydrogenase [Anaerolineaceae bacterium]